MDLMPVDPTSSRDRWVVVPAGIFKLYPERSGVCTCRFILLEKAFQNNSYTAAAHLQLTFSQSYNHGYKRCSLQEACCLYRLRRQNTCRWLSRLFVFTQCHTTGLSCYQGRCGESAADTTKRCRGGFLWQCFIRKVRQMHPSCCTSANLLAVLVRTLPVNVQLEPASVNLQYAPQSTRSAPPA